MRDLASILADLRRIAPDIRHRYGVTELAVFGSYVRGEQGPDSDLDLLVDFSAPPSLFEYAGLQAELTDRMGIKVDLVNHGTLKPLMRPFIEAEKIAL